MQESIDNSYEASLNGLQIDQSEFELHIETNKYASLPFRILDRMENMLQPPEGSMATRTESDVSTSRAAYPDLEQNNGSSSSSSSLFGSPVWMHSNKHTDEWSFGRILQASLKRYDDHYVLFERKFLLIQRALEKLSNNQIYFEDFSDFIDLCITNREYLDILKDKEREIYENINPIKCTLMECCKYHIALVEISKRIQTTRSIRIIAHGLMGSLEQSLPLVKRWLDETLTTIGFVNYIKRLILESRKK